MAEQFSNAPAPSREEFEALSEQIGNRTPSIVYHSSSGAKTTTITFSTATTTAAYKVTAIGGSSTVWASIMLRYSNGLILVNEEHGTDITSISVSGNVLSVARTKNGVTFLVELLYGDPSEYDTILNDISFAN